MQNKISNHIIIMGAPGCGKGTQAKLIAKEFAYMHLSTGELFRKKYAQQNEETQAGKASIDKGGFFSDEIAYQIIQDFIAENAEAKGIIYDGFPRDLTQAKYFLENISEKPVVIVLQADEKELEKRLLERGKQSHRADDGSANIIKHRMELYHELTQPVVQFFEEKGLLNSINGNGSIEEIATRIHTLLA